MIKICNWKLNSLKVMIEVVWGDRWDTNVSARENIFVSSWTRSYGFSLKIILFISGYCFKTIHYCYAVLVCARVKQEFQGSFNQGITATPLTSFLWSLLTNCSLLLVCFFVCFCLVGLFLFNWNSPHIRLNSHCKS